MDKKTMVLLATDTLTGDQLSGLTGAQLSGLTGAQLSGLTRAQLSGLTRDQLSGLTRDQLSGLTGDQLSGLTRDQLWWLTRDQEIPKVELLYSRMLADITNSDRLLDQSTFGPSSPLPETVCKTPMCVAGHTVNLAGPEGYKLEKAFGFAGAARLIHNASRPDVSAPRYDSYPNEWALAYIEARAKEEVMGRNSPIDTMAMQKQTADINAAGHLAGSPYQPTLRERLTGQQARLTKQLEDINAAIEALDKNPNFEEVLDVIGKAQY